MSENSKCTNKHECTCHNTNCENYGRCCNCVAYHKANGDLPVCLRKLNK